MVFVKADWCEVFNWFFFSCFSDCRENNVRALNYIICHVKKGWQSSVQNFAIIAIEFSRLFCKSNCPPMIEVLCNRRRRAMRYQITRYLQTIIGFHCGVRHLPRSDRVIWAIGDLVPRLDWNCVRLCYLIFCFVNLVVPPESWCHLDEKECQENVLGILLLFGQDSLLQLFLFELWERIIFIM